MTSEEESDSDIEVIDNQREEIKSYDTDKLGNLECDLSNQPLRGNEAAYSRQGKST